MHETSTPDPGEANASAYIKLDQFLKWVGAVETGGHAKQVVQDGQVQVNGETETRRGRKLRKGDRVAFEGKSWSVDPEQR
ncbi:MAG: RNA-binding S4 domain-containing protein [Vulcanimicrobiota bacterium]